MSDRELVNVCTATCIHNEVEVTESCSILEGDEEWRCLHCPGVVFCHTCAEKHTFFFGEHDMYRLDCSVQELHARTKKLVEDVGRTWDPKCLIEHAFQVYKNLPFLLIPGQRWYTYGECASGIAYVASIISETSGAAILSGENSIGWIVSYLGCMLAGKPAILIDPTVTANDAWQEAYAAINALNDTRATVAHVFVDEKLLVNWKHVSQNSSVTSLDQISEHMGIVSARVLSPTESVGFASASTPMTCLFTSGSTGRPKPLWFSCGAWNDRGITVANLEAKASKLAPDGYALASPLYHSNGFWTVWRALQRGACIGIIDPHRSDVIEAIGAVAPSSFTAVPRFWELVRTRFQRELTLNGGNEDKAYQSTRALLGKRLRSVAIGSAHVSQNLLRFLENTFGIGGPGGGHAIVTEGYGCTEFGQIWADGFPAPGVQVKLGSAGEILVRHKVAARCVGTVDSEGFYHTGDIGQQISSNPSKFAIVDRASASIKLANGKFFCPGPVEAELESRCPSVESCALIARPGDDRPIAVLVLHKEKDIQLGHASLVEEIAQAAQECSLNAWQIPRKVYVDVGPWTHEFGLRTGLGKLRRDKIAQRIPILRPVSDDRPECLENAVVGFLCAESDEQALACLALSARHSPLMFKHLGGDSIMAAQIVEKLPHLNPADLLSRCLWQVRVRETTKFDWTAQVDRAAGQHISPSPHTCVGPTKKLGVLLTGCTGFIGQYLLEALAKRYPKHTIICIVRQESVVEALAQVAGSGTLFLKGDVSRPHIGMSKSSRERVQDFCIELVVHNAAIVDHAQGYETLASANVDSIGHLVNLFAHHPPRMVFISSMSAVPRGTTKEEVIGPDAAEKVGTGYGQTKLIAENGLVRATEEGRIDSLVIFRVGLVGIHSETGHGNPRDWFHLLLLAVLSSNAVPKGLLETKLASLPVNVAADDIAEISSVKQKPGSIAVIHMDAIARGYTPSRQFHHAIMACEDLLKKTFLRDVDFEKWKTSLQGEARRALLAIPSSFSSSKRILLNQKVRTLDRKNLAKALHTTPNATFDYPSRAAWKKWAQDKGEKMIVTHGA